jgi:osmotically-inducible protein OsmY
MKKTFVWFSSISLIILLALSATAQEMQKKPPKTQKASTPTTDADIQKCIEEKFASAASLKDKKPTVSVSGGVATITGEAKNGGAKGGATKIARSCGSKEVKNEMTVAASTKKPTEKKN